MAQLRETSSHHFVLTGDVSLADVSALSRWPVPFEGGRVALSLGEVASADSAIAALLLQWTRQADKAKTPLVITDCPAPVRLLLNLYDLESIFGI